MTKLPRDMPSMLFKGPLLASIRRGDKLQTRRVMKTQPPAGATEVYIEAVHGEMTVTYRAFPDGGSARWAVCGCRHEIGNVLYLKEGLTNCCHSALYQDGSAVVDRRTGKMPFVWPWQCKTLSSMLMPRHAARDYLTVTDVRAERVQDISREDVRFEGVPETWGDWRGDPPKGMEPHEWDNKRFDKQWAWLWDSINAKPKPVYKTHKTQVGQNAWIRSKRIDHYVSYPWEDIQETREHRGKPWHVIGNAWVFAYTFSYMRDIGRELPK